ncbi:MAG: serine/threonine protein kinase, partial [Myxococcales bacterium]|nr:serine/threonine protein kinase [Myxococcales bacterium]
MRLFANEILLGRYRLESLLGEGGMGMVWRARDHQEDRDVAIKFVKDAAGPDEHRRFLREARAAMAVDHPAIVRVFSVETAPDGTPMMIMELLRGETLAEMIERVGRLTLAQCADIFLPIVSAVGTAHAKGVIHRDLKPENVFLVEVPKGKPPEVRVLDFGIAKLTALEGDAKATAGLTSTGTLLGTPYYMSPEQVFADKDLDHRADIWSLGVVLYECLSGRKPVQGDSLGQLLRVITTASMPPLRALSPELPEDVLALNERMLRVDRNDRPSDLREVYTVFRAYTSAQASPFSGATLRISGLPEHGIGTGPVAAVAPALTPAPGQMPSDSGARSGSISASTPMPSGVPSGRPGWLLPAALVAGLVVAGGGFGLRSAMTAPAAGTAP